MFDRVLYPRMTAGGTAQKGCWGPLRAVVTDREGRTTASPGDRLPRPVQRAGPGQLAMLVQCIQDFSTRLRLVCPVYFTVSHDITQVLHRISHTFRGFSRVFRGPFAALSRPFRGLSRTFRASFALPSHSLRTPFALPFATFRTPSRSLRIPSKVPHRRPASPRCSLAHQKRLRRPRGGPRASFLG